MSSVSASPIVAGYLDIGGTSGSGEGGRRSFSRATSIKVRPLAGGNSRLHPMDVSSQTAAIEVSVNCAGVDI